MSRSKTSVSYTIREAAEAASIGHDKIRAAVEVGDLMAYYDGVKALILADDLVEFVRSLPVKRRSS